MVPNWAGRTPHLAVAVGPHSRYHVAAARRPPRLDEGLLRCFLGQDSVAEHQASVGTVDGTHRFGIPVAKPRCIRPLRHQYQRWMGDLLARWVRWPPRLNVARREAFTAAALGASEARAAAVTRKREGAQ
jgi:hypothetical protein